MSETKATMATPYLMKDHFDRTFGGCPFCGSRDCVAGACARNKTIAADLLSLLQTQLLDKLKLAEYADTLLIINTLRLELTRQRAANPNTDTVAHQKRKASVQQIMDFARKFRSAPGDLYDAAYKDLQEAVYNALSAQENSQ